MSIKTRYRNWMASTLVCPQCKTRFTPATWRKRFCCEACRISYNNGKRKARYKNDPAFKAKCLRRSKQYYQNNSEEIMKKVKEYQEKNPDKKKQWSKNWWENASEETREKNRQRSLKNYHKHKEEINKRRREMRHLGLWK